LAVVAFAQSKVDHVDGLSKDSPWVRLRTDVDAVSVPTSVGHGPIGSESRDNSSALPQRRPREDPLSRCREPVAPATSAFVSPETGDTPLKEPLAHKKEREEEKERECPVPPASRKNALFKPFCSQTRASAFTPSTRPPFAPPRGGERTERGRRNAGREEGRGPNKAGEDRDGDSEKWRFRSRSVFELSPDAY